MVKRTKPIVSRAAETAHMRSEQKADRARARFTEKQAELDALLKKKEEERQRGGAPKPSYHIPEDILKDDDEDEYTP